MNARERLERESIEDGKCKEADVPMENVDHLASWLEASCNPCTGTLSSLHFKRTWTTPPLIDYPRNVRLSLLLTRVLFQLVRVSGRDLPYRRLVPKAKLSPTGNQDSSSAGVLFSSWYHVDDLFMRFNRATRWLI